MKEQLPEKYCGIGKVMCPYMEPTLKDWKEVIKEWCLPCHELKWKLENKGEDFCQDD